MAGGKTTRRIVARRSGATVDGLVFCAVGLAGSMAVVAFLSFLMIVLIRRLNETWLDPQWRFARRLRRLFDSKTPGREHEGQLYFDPELSEETEYVVDDGIQPQPPKGS
jgi:hypothetical protein